jgi:hypothetical protein
MPLSNKLKTMKTQSKTNEMIQSIIVTFDDGSEATFTGPAVCFKGDKRKISNIIFTEPKLLPENCSWGSF